MSTFFSLILSHNHIYSDGPKSNRIICVLGNLPNLKIFKRSALIPELEDCPKGDVKQYTAKWYCDLCCGAMMYDDKNSNICQGQNELQLFNTTLAFFKTKQV